MYFNLGDTVKSVNKREHSNLGVIMYIDSAWSQFGGREVQKVYVPILAEKYKMMYCCWPAYRPMVRSKIILTEKVIVKNETDFIGKIRVDS
jgi:hypothetical protein